MATLDFLDSLIGTESGGDWAAQNDEVGAGGQAGHFGRLQFGQARLTDAKSASVIPSSMTPQQFMADPAAQQAVEAWHFSDIDKQAASMGLNSYLGQTIGGATITPQAIQAMAHLGGIGGAAKFLKTGGQYNPSDAYGTSLLDYALKHGGTGGPALNAINAATGGAPRPIMRPSTFGKPPAKGNIMTSAWNGLTSALGGINPNMQQTMQGIGQGIMKAANPLGTIQGRTAIIDGGLKQIFNGPKRENAGSGGYDRTTGKFRTTLNQGPVWQSSGPDHTSTTPLIRDANGVPLKYQPRKTS